MKKISAFSVCTVFAALLFFQTTKAQKTLEFNQVKLVTTSETVPAGKVWKIEGVFYSSNVPDPHCTGSTNYSSITPLNDIIIVGGANTTIRSFNSSGGANVGFNSVLWEKEFPMWLPEGTSLAAGTGVSKISVIEFTVQ